MSEIECTLAYLPEPIDVLTLFRVWIKSHWIIFNKQYVTNSVCLMCNFMAHHGFSTQVVTFLSVH